MNIHSQKIELAQLIFSIDDKAILKKVKEVLIPSKDSVLDALHDDVRKSVNIAIKQLEEGKGIPHKEAVRKIKQWQKK